jgi:hypothetical protein
MQGFPDIDGTEGAPIVPAEEPGAAEPAESPAPEPVAEAPAQLTFGAEVEPAPGEPAAEGPGEPAFTETDFVAPAEAGFETAPADEAAYVAPVPVDPVPEESAEPEFAPAPAVSAEPELVEDVKTAAVDVAPELEAIRAELGDSAEPAEEAPLGEVAAAAAASGAALEIPLAEQILDATQGAEAEAGALETQDPSGEDAEAVETWLESEGEEEFERPRRNLAMSVPFFVYVGIWLIFCIAEVLMLKDTSMAGTPVYSETYAAFVYGAVALTALGPLLALVVWLLSRYWAASDQRRGLFAIAALRGAIATFSGVLLNTGALYILDMVKTGVLKW